MVKTTHLTFILVASQIYLWRRVQIISDLEAAAAPKDFGKLRWRAPRFLSGLGFSRIFYPKQNQMPSKPDSILWFHNSWREVEATRRGTAQDRVLEKEEQSPQLSASLVNPEQFVKGEREVKAMCFLKCKVIYNKIPRACEKHDFCARLKNKKHLIKYLLDCLVQWDNIIICYIITLYKGRQIHWHQVWSLRHMTYLPRSRQWAPKCSQKMPWWELHWLVWNCESSTKTMGFIQGHASHLPAIVSKERVTKIKRPIFRWGTQDHLQTWNIWVETLYNIWI